MVDDDFDLDSLMSEVEEPSKGKKKRRLVGSNDEGENFTFDFNVDERATTISSNDNNAAYNPEEVEPANNTQESALETKEPAKKETKKDSKKDKKEEKNKIKEDNPSKNKKSKRAFEGTDFDFGGVTEETKKTVLKDVKNNKDKVKRRIISGNEFDILDEELEKIHEIQSQIKANKSNAAQLTKQQEEEKIKKRINITIRVIVLITLFAIIGFAYLVIRHNSIISDQKRIKISQADGVSNSSNFIYLDVPIQFEDSVIKINKIRLDSQELALYLETAVDFDKYEFHILDDNLNRYYDTTDYSLDFNKGSDVELTFEPLAYGTKKFSLKIENIETGYNTETIFELENPIKYPNVKFYYDALPVDNTLYVQSSIFSSAFTKTTVIAKGDKSDVEFINEENVASGNLYIKHKGVSVPLENGETDYAYFEEYDLGISIIKHAPLSTLVGSIEYGAENIYKQKSVEEYIDIASLNLGNKIKDTVYSNNVVIEGIYNYDGIIVLPMNGRKVNAIPNSPNVHYEVDSNGRYSSVVTENPNDEYYDKISVTLEATLYAKDDEGNEFAVVADSRIGDEGTDVIFKDDRLKGKELSEVQILIHNYVTIEDGVSKVISLENTQNTQKTNDADFEDVVRESFLKRLKFKSRELTESYVTGFDEDLITNFEFDQVYEAVPTSTSAYYSTFIEGFAFENNLYYAIVSETWAAKDLNGETIKMNNRHKIIAEKQGRNYIIIYDKIIE